MAELKLEVLLNAVDRMTKPVRAAMLSTKGLSDAAKKAQTEISKLNQTQKKIDGFRNLQQQMQKTELQIKQSNKALIVMEKEIRNTSAPNKTLLRQHERLEKSHIKQLQARDNEQRSLKSYQQELEEAGVSVNNLEKSETELQKKLETSRKAFDKQAPAIEKSKKELASLNKIQRDLKGFQKLNDGLENTTLAFKHQRQEVGRLQKEFDQTNKPTKKMIKNLQKAKEKLVNLELAEKQQSQSLKNMDQALDRAGYSTSDLGKAQRKVGTEIRKTNKDIGTQFQKLDKLAQAQRKINKLKSIRDRSLQRASNLTVAGGGAIMAARSAMNVMGTVGQSESRIADIAITANLDDSQVDEARQKISDLINKTHQTKENLTLGLDTMVTAGMDFDKAKGFLKPVAETATAAKADIQDISKTVYALRENLNIKDEAGMTKALDMLTVGGKKGAFELKDMAKHMPSLTAKAKMLKIEGSEAIATLGAALQIAKDAAGTADEGANNMENFLAKMKAPVTVKNFKKYGVDLEAELANAANPIEKMIQLTKKLTDGDSFKMGELFQDMQVQNFITPMIQQYEKYKEIKKSMNAADGEVQKDLTRRFELDPTLATQDIAESFKDLKDQALIPLLPPITELVKKITAVLKPVGQWIKENPELSSTLLQGTLAIGGMVAALGVLSFAIGTLTAPLAIARYGMKRFGLLTGITKGGIGKLIKVIAMFAGRLGILSTVMGSLGFSKLLTGLAMARKGLWAGGKATVFFLGRLAALSGILASMAFAKLAAGVMFAVKAFRVLGAVLLANPIILIATAIAAAAYLIYDNWDVIKQYLEKFWDVIKPYFTAAWEFIKEAFSWTPLGMVMQNWEPLMEFFRGLPESFANFGTMMMHGLADGIMAGVNLVKDKVIGVGKKIKAWFTGETEIKSPSRVFIKYGKYIMQGLGLGVKDNADMPVLETIKVARRLPQEAMQVANDANYTKPAMGLVKKIAATALLSTTASLPLAAQPLLGNIAQSVPCNGLINLEAFKAYNTQK